MSSLQIITIVSVSLNVIQVITIIYLLTRREDIKNDLKLQKMARGHYEGEANHWKQQFLKLKGEEGE